VTCVEGEVMTITVELNAEQTLALQQAQYRNGEELSHTLLRLAGLIPSLDGENKL